MKIDVGQKSGCGIRAVKGRVGYHISHAENADSVTAAHKELRSGKKPVGCIASYRLISLGTALYRLAVGRGRFENPTRFSKADESCKNGEKVARKPANRPASPAIARLFLGGKFLATRTEVAGSCDGQGSIA